MYISLKTDLTLIWANVQSSFVETGDHLVKLLEGDVIVGVGAVVDENAVEHLENILIVDPIS